MAQTIQPDPETLLRNVEANQANKNSNRIRLGRIPGANPNDPGIPTLGSKQNPTLNDYAKELAKYSTSKAQFAQQRQTTENAEKIRADIENILQANPNLDKEARNQLIWDTIFNKENFVEKIWESEGAFRQLCIAHGDPNKTVEDHIKDFVRNDLFIDQKRTFSDFNRYEDFSVNNRRFQNLIETVAQRTSTIGVSQNRLIGRLNQDIDENDKIDSSLANALNPFFKYAGYEVPIGSLSRKDAINAMQRTVGERTYDLTEEFGHGITQFRERNNLDNFLDSNIDRAFDEPLNVDMVNQGNKEVLAKEFANLSHYKVEQRANTLRRAITYEIIEEAREILGANKKTFGLEELKGCTEEQYIEEEYKAKKKASKMLRKALLTYMTKKWEAANATSEQINSLGELMEDAAFSDYIISSTLGRKENLVDNLIRADDAFYGQRTSRIWTGLGYATNVDNKRDSVKRELLRDAETRIDSKHRNLEEAVEKVAVQGGFKIHKRVLTGEELVKADGDLAYHGTYGPGDKDYDEMVPTN